MKIFTRILVLGLMVLAFSCTEAERFTQFDLNYNTSFTIPASVGIQLPVDLFTPDITTNSESEFQSRSTRKDLLEEVKLTRLDLSITSPDNQDFSFLESVRLYLSAEGLNEIEIAGLSEIPDTIGNTLVLVIPENNLKEFLKKEGFKLRVNTLTDEILSQDIQVELAASFFIDAKVLGR